MSSLCERPGCSLPGEASYGMVAEELTFWIDHLNPTIRAGVLCSKHADSMSVPRGWTLIDRREPDLHLFSLRPPRDAAVPPPRSPGDGLQHRVAKSPAPAKPAHAAAPPSSASRRSGFEQLPMMLPLTETASAADGADRPQPEQPNLFTAPPVNAWPSPPGSGAVDGSPFSAPVSTTGSVSADVVEDEVPTADLPLLDELKWDDPTTTSSEPVVGADTNGDPNKPWIPTFDQTDDLDGMLDVASPLLRRAFRGGPRKTAGESRKT